MNALLRSTVLLALALGHPATASAECTVEGTVVDEDGQPVVGIDVRLMQGSAPRHTVTDEQGHFTFAAVPGPTEVFAVLGEGGRTPRFVMTKGGETLQLRGTVEPDRSCTVALDASAHPRGSDLLPLYQGLWRGLTLMERLGIRPKEPLRVEIDDAIASPTEAYWAGTFSFHPEGTQPARLVLGTAATRHDDPGAPDNREYHELGHHALATAFGALPKSRDDALENDYHHNPGSTHAFTEGFAIFFAAMVAREIEQRPDAGRYRVEGALVDLELDYRPWDLRGTESIAVASLLWDVVDGDRPAAGPSLEIHDLELDEREGTPPILIGRVVNPTDAPVTDARVRVQAGEWTGTALVGPSSLPHGGEGWFALPIPAASVTGDDPLAALTTHATTIHAATDDDPVQAELSEVWEAIAQFRSEQPGSNERLFDVVDLHRALRERLGGKDADGDGVDDIDQLFVAHGLHADPNGNRTYDAGETLGETSHPGRSIDVDGQPQQWPALEPRRRLTLPAGLRMRVEAPADATLVVATSGSTWGGYVVEPDAAGEIRIVPPPAEPGARVSLIAMAPQHRPTVVWQHDAGALLEELEGHATPYLTVTAQLDALGTRTSSSATGAAWPRFAFAGGALAAVLGLLLVALGWPRFR